MKWCLNLNSARATTVANADAAAQVMKMVLSNAASER